MARKTIKDGEWFHIPRSGRPVGCCDCGLTHIFQPVVKNGKVFMRVYRSDLHTRDQREERGITIKQHKRPTQPKGT